MSQILVRKAAMKLLKAVYEKANSELSGTADVKPLLDNGITSLVMQQASKYLIEKRLVESKEIAVNTWSAKITYQGIDWMEDNFDKF